jgi:hypothetical protein
MVARFDQPVQPPHVVWRRGLVRSAGHPRDEPVRQLPPVLSYAPINMAVQMRASRRERLRWLARDLITFSSSTWKRPRRDRNRCPSESRPRVAGSPCPRCCSTHMRSDPRSVPPSRFEIC